MTVGRGAGAPLAGVRQRRGSREVAPSAFRRSQFDTFQAVKVKPYRHICRCGANCAHLRQVLGPARETPPKAKARQPLKYRTLEKPAKLLNGRRKAAR